MFTINSETMTDEYISDTITVEQWKYNITNGNTGEIVISDPLLDSVERATERAKSEFLKNSYRLKQITFTTQRTDIVKNMIINVQGVPYLVKSISTVITKTAIKSKIRGIRYE